MNNSPAANIESCEFEQVVDFSEYKAMFFLRHMRGVLLQAKRYGFERERFVSAINQRFLDILSFLDKKDVDFPARGDLVLHLEESRENFRVWSQGDVFLAMNKLYGEVCYLIRRYGD